MTHHLTQLMTPIWQHIYSAPPIFGNFLFQTILKTHNFPKHPDLTESQVTEYPTSPTYTRNKAVLGASLGKKVVLVLERDRRKSGDRQHPNRRCHDCIQAQNGRLSRLWPSSLPWSPSSGSRYLSQTRNGSCRLHSVMSNYSESVVAVASPPFSRAYEATPFCGLAMQQWAELWGFC